MPMGGAFAQALEQFDVGRPTLLWMRVQDCNAPRHPRHGPQGPVLKTTSFTAVTPFVGVGTLDVPRFQPFGLAQG